MASGTPALQYVAISSGGLLIYDYLCTLESEVSNVWTCSLSLVTSVFYVNRYLPFVDTTILIIFNMGVPHLPTCQSLTQAYVWILAVGSILSHMITIARTCALWGYRRWILGLVGVVGVLEFSAGLTAAYYQFKSFRFGVTQAGCSIHQTGRIITVAYAMIFSMEAIIVVLTLLVAYRHLSISHSLWIRHLYHNGIVFCCMMLAISLVNVIFPWVVPPIYRGIFATPQRVFHSIICNRVILMVLKHRRRIVDKDSEIFGIDDRAWRDTNIHQGGATATINTELFQIYYTSDIRTEIGISEVVR